MRSNFRWAPLIFGMTICFGIATPIFLGQQQPVAAQSTPTKKAKLKLKVRRQPPAPPSRGYPAVGDAAISRGNCADPGVKLVALAPSFVQKGLNSGDSEERSVWGQTTMEHPTVWFLVPLTDRLTQLEFFLQNREGQVIYQSKIPTPSKDGIMGVRIPQSKSLELNKHYLWTLKARSSCGGPLKFVDGWMQRVSLPVGTDVSSNPTQVYVDRGIWYDAVNSLAQQRLMEPNNAQLQQDWRDLLGSVNLVGIGQQPLLP